MIPLNDDNPTERPPVVTVSLIILCTLVFLYEATLTEPLVEAFVYRYGAIPAALFGHLRLPAELEGLSPTATLLTSMFLHGGWMHLIGNMLYLWIFGNNIEDVMGHVRFVIFYIACGILAALSHALTDPAATVPMVGASGAISGVLGAYLLLFPHARVLVAIPLGFVVQTVRMPAGAVLALWFVLQLLSNLFASGEGGGAFRAHIGGFIAGMLLTPLFKRKDVPLRSLVGGR